jgi:hypothetical protein
MAAVSGATVGALVASRRPAHPVGWLLLGLGLLVPADGVVSEYAHYGLEARPGALLAASYLAGISNGTQVLMLACVGFVLLLTPTGSLPSPRWRWWARVRAAAPLLLLLLTAVDPHPWEDPTVDNPLAVPAPLVGPLTAVAAVDAVIVLATVIAAAGSLVVRFRRARGTERQQLRWLAFAAALAAVALLVGWPPR